MSEPSVATRVNVPPVVTTLQFENDATPEDTPFGLLVHENVPPLDGFRARLTLPVFKVVTDISAGVLNNHDLRLCSRTRCSDVELLGCWVKPSFVAAPTVMLKALTRIACQSRGARCQGVAVSELVDRAAGEARHPGAGVHRVRGAGQTAPTRIGADGKSDRRRAAS